MKNKQRKQSLYVKMLLLTLALFNMTCIAFAQDYRIIKGKVLDSNKEPITGATVVVKKSNVGGTATDLNGNFNISVPDSKAVLLISFVGYITKEIAVGNQRNLIITLIENSELLDEVVVVGFQTQKKVNLTGAVANISSDAFENRPVTNIGQALQGVVPGLNIDIASGSPGKSPNLNIRGGASVGLVDATNAKKGFEVKKSSPLILVDGIEVSSEQLNLLNPADIENTSVIKDASASAIYGARAAFGVVLVTTKTGKNNEKARVNYSFDMQWNTPAHKPNMLDAYTQKYASVMQKVYTVGGSISSDDEQILAAIQKHIANPSVDNSWFFLNNDPKKLTWVGNYNPFELAVSDRNPMVKHNLSISGGTAKINYNVSLGFQNQEGFYKIQEDNLRRFNGSIHLNAQITDWFELGVKASYNTSRYIEPVSGNDTKGELWPAMRNEAARNINIPLWIGPNEYLSQSYPTDNIVSWYSSGANRKTYRTLSMYSLNPTFKITPELKLKGEFIYKPTSYETNMVRPVVYYIGLNSFTPSNANSNRGNLEKDRNKDELFTMNLYADYMVKLGKKHTLSALLGYNQEAYFSDHLNMKGNGISIDELPIFNMLTNPNRTIVESRESWSVRGGFGRINYNFSDRYLFELNGRYDGSSKFVKNDRFKLFPSFSAAWRMSEEDFLKSTRGWLDNLKLRGSYGSIGNQNGATAYGFRQLLDKATQADYVFAGLMYPGVYAGKLVSQNYTWETAVTINGGLDFTLLQGRLDASFDIYNRKTKDMLTPGATLPSVLGADAPYENSGILNTNGWELSLMWKDKLSCGLRYDVLLVVSDSQSKLSKYNGNNTKLLSDANDNNKLYQGKKWGEIWGYTTDRILQKEDFNSKGEITYMDKDGDVKVLKQMPENSNLTYYPGDILYKDLDGDGTVNYGSNTADDSGDKRIIGNNTPRYVFGLTTNFAYKGFDLSLFFNGIGKRDLWIDDTTFWGNLSGTGNWEVYNNSWTPERTNAKYPLYGARAQNTRVQTGYLFDGSYIRLKQIVLGYTVPSSSLSKLKISHLRFNVAAYNLFKITDIPDVFDPELISANYPQMKSMAIGVQVSF